MKHCGPNEVENPLAYKSYDDYETEEELRDRLEQEAEYWDQKYDEYKDEQLLKEVENNGR